MPWFGAVLDAVLIPGPPGRADVVQAAAVLSEGGQIHVHDLRFIDGGAGSTGGISPGDAEAPGGSRRLTQILPRSLPRQGFRAPRCSTRCRA